MKLITIILVGNRSGLYHFPTCFSQPTIRRFFYWSFGATAKVKLNIDNPLFCKDTAHLQAFEVPLPNITYELSSTHTQQGVRSKAEIADCIWNHQHLQISLISPNWKVVWLELWLRIPYLIWSLYPPCTPSSLIGINSNWPA